MNDPSNPLTETEQRVRENQEPAARQPVTRQPGETDPATGLVPGQHDDDRSALDRGMPLDPTGAKPEPAP